MRLVDADALITAVFDEAWYDNRDEDIAYELVENAKTVEPKRGTWEPDEYEFYSCSLCGFEMEDREDSSFNFCPHCGADMR